MVFGLVLMTSIPGGIAKSLDRLWNPPEGELFELSRMPMWTRSEDRKVGLEILQFRRQFLQDMQRITQKHQSNGCIYSELPALVTAQTQRVALVSPWKTPEDLDISKIQCPFYYMIPSAFPDTKPTDVDEFGSVHRELFRSKAPYNTKGIELLGVFFELQKPADKTD
jgi:hypothetical protein